jgi:PPK2 family polyphosphate:nucleotide phosphotransferase
MKHSPFLVSPGKKIKLSQFDPGYHGEFKDKEAAKTRLEEDIERMRELQDVFYASDSHSLLIIFQALDAAGKDGAIKHVMSGLNPQGCQVAAFKSPSSRELDHDYLWRCNIFLPERGRIGIFNRSYYEEVLVVRVHPEYLDAQRLPHVPKGGKVWTQRYREINNYEKYLTDNGTRILKFFLNVSREEQRKRFLQRIERPEKNWKLSPSDVKERAHWDEYQDAYEEMLNATSTEAAPWHVIPADKKWFSRVAIANVIVKALESMNLKYPSLNEHQRSQLEEAHRLLLAEE